MTTTATLESAPSEALASSGAGRSVAAALCLILAVLLTVPAAVAYWGQRTLTDTQRYLATVEPALLRCSIAWVAKSS